MSKRAEEVNIYTGKVVQTKQDQYHSDLIKVRLEPDDSKRTNDQIPYAIPLLPKMFYVKPKVGEMVAVLVGEMSGQRWYIGPMISQPQKMYNDELSSAARMMGGTYSPSESIDNNGDSSGTMPKDDDIAILGRKSSDIILSDDEIKIRSGVRLTDKNGNGVKFNRDAPAFIKLKYHETPIHGNDIIDKEGHGTARSTATIFADKVNLISPNGDGWSGIKDRDGLISDQQMSELISSAHRLPYGDELCKFLSLFLKMYMNHSHPYSGMPPLNADPESSTFWSEYMPSKEKLEDKLLSKDISIN